MLPHELSQFIKTEAISLGFAVCGITKAEPLPNDITSFVDNWLDKGMHGTMSYLERNRDKRYNPALLVPECRSIICVALNYYPSVIQEDIPHLSRYALGNDYHRIVKDKLYLLLQKLSSVATVKGRPFCDSAPIMERYWAKQSGLGWIGKNHQLIIPKAGTHFFLGELFVDVELEYDKPFEKEYCGNCDACLRNCPTGALSVDGFDARRCLSYLTIEHREELPDGTGKKMGNCIYGCDKCHSCCPHNRFAVPSLEPSFVPKKELLDMQGDDWINLSKDKYKELFSDSAVERCGYEQLMRNIKSAIE